VLDHLGVKLTRSRGCEVPSLNPSLSKPTAYRQLVARVLAL